MTRQLQVVALQARAVERPLLRPVGAASHRTETRLSLEVTVECDLDGRIRFGTGEASPLVGYSLDSFEEVKGVLESVASRLPWQVSLDGDVVATVETRCGALPPAARCALETALLDVVGQIERRPLWSLLTGASSPPTSSLPLASQLLGPDHALVDEARSLLALGYRSLKRKIDADRAEDQLSALAAVTGIELRLDGNAALPRETLLRIGPHVDRLRPALFEEPILGDLAARLQTSDAALDRLPIALDESLRERTARAALARLGAFKLDDVRIKAIVVKPTRDGLLGALRLAQAARTAGIPTVVTHTWDGPIARLAAAHLAIAVHRPGGFAHAITLPPAVTASEHAPAHQVLAAAVNKGVLVPPLQGGLGTASDNG